ncbi:MAG: hypothetical protein AAGN66_10890 [Acidobacteriota bacterium]
MPKKTPRSEGRPEIPAVTEASIAPPGGSTSKAPSAPELDDVEYGPAAVEAVLARSQDLLPHRAALAQASTALELANQLVDDGDRRDYRWRSLIARSAAGLATGAVEGALLDLIYAKAELRNMSPPEVQARFARTHDLFTEAHWALGNVRPALVSAHLAVLVRRLGHDPLTAARGALRLAVLRYASRCELLSIPPLCTVAADALGTSQNEDDRRRRRAGACLRVLAACDCFAPSPALEPSIRDLDALGRDVPLGSSDHADLLHARGIGHGALADAEAALDDLHLAFEIHLDCGQDDRAALDAQDLLRVGSGGDPGSAEGLARSLRQRLPNRPTPPRSVLDLVSDPGDPEHLREVRERWILTAPPFVEILGGDPSLGPAR